MRNFKKVLSLVLCMAMMLSVMVVGAGAAFNDQSKIKNTEAVDMCSALNIINGYTDGSFKPEGTITRAEACKMICVALNGGKEPVLGTNATASFTDIKGHWAEGYIEYCVSEGIVAGVGGGKFAPNATVTGSQFAKMLLIALGYRADHENFLGNAWEVNVNVKATQKGLYEDLASMDPSAALTRDNAAQMVWNALQAMQVKYEYTLVSENGQLVSKVTVKDDKDAGTLLRDKYDGLIAEGILDTVTYNSDKEEWTYTVNQISYTGDVDYCDLYKQAVKVVYTVKNNGDVDEFLGMISDADVIVEGIVGDIEAIDVANAEVEIDDVDYKLNKGTNGVAVTAYTNIKGDSQSLADLIADNSTDPYTFKAIDNNDDGRIDVIVYLPIAVQKITYVNSTGIRIGTKAYDFDDHNIYDGAEKDDWAVVVAAANTCNGEAVITKADVVEGKVTSVDGTDVRVDGVWYEKATVANKNPQISNEVELIVANGYYFNVDNASTDLDVAVVTGVGNYDKMDDVVMVKLMFQDGKEEVVPVENWDGDVTSDVDKEAGVMVSYDIDDGDYTLTTVTNGKIGDTSYTGVVVPNAKSLKYDKDEAAIVGTSATYDIADSAMIVLYDGDDYTYMTGETLLTKNDITFASAYIAVDDNEVGALYATTNTSVTSGDELYGYIVDAYTALNDDEDEVLYIDVIVDGEKLSDVETDVETSSAAGWIKAVVTYTMDGDVMCIEKDPDTYTKAAIDDYNASRVLFTDTTRKLLTKDTVIIAIDSDDAKDVLYAGDSLMEANAKFDENGKQTGYWKNAMYKANSDKEIEVIFVEVASDAEF